MVIATCECGFSTTDIKAIEQHLEKKHNNKPKNRSLTQIKKELDKLEQIQENIQEIRTFFKTLYNKKEYQDNDWITHPVEDGDDDAIELLQSIQNIKKGLKKPTTQTPEDK